MADLKFADTHNMIVFLSKHAESEEFEQIVDFLNANHIKYALTINPTIYISCIEQFWSTAKAKTVNGEVQLHALVDGKKIIVTESIVRRDLHLEDAEGVDCLPNAIIFEQLALMRNMKSMGKGFFGRITPLFPTIVVQNQAEMGEGLEIPTDPNHTPIFIQPTKPQKTQKPRKPKRKDTKIPQSSGPTAHVADEVVYKERGDSLVKVATIASSLEAEQGSGNINKTRSKATPNEAGSQGTTSGGGPRHQDTMGDTIAQTRFENVFKISNDLLLARGNTLRSGEDSLKLKKLMELCTNLQTRVPDLEKTKTSQRMEIDSLKRRVKRLERKGRSRTHKLKRLYKVGLTARVDSSEEEEVLGEDASKQGRIIDDIDDDEDITLVSGQDDADADMFDVNALAGVEESAEQEVAAKDVNLSVDEVTLAQALAALKSVKPKVKEPSVPVSAAIATIKVSVATTTIVIIPTPRKGIVITELEPEKPLEKKDQINFDEETARKLQAEFDKEERLAREKDEANVALTEEWGDIQAKVDVDF
ncbi:hypothetical protein Tco_0012474 [Tanacetum coccineum]